jgi:FKBP-type peptidyl-prolyl cis-trans isomerase SlyD
MIQKDSVVGITYVLTNNAGVELDQADKNDPFYYLHGASNIVPGLEDELEGLKVGDKRKVAVAPELGYGEINPNLKIKVGRNAFPAGTEIEVGMQFAADVGAGQPMPFTVEKVEGDDIFLDGNHPLAGETLNFDVEVVSVRQATADELSHGHAHGPDGHAHH